MNKVDVSFDMEFTISWLKNGSKWMTNIFPYKSVTIIFLAILITNSTEVRVLELNLHDLKQDTQVCQFSRTML